MKRYYFTFMQSQYALKDYYITIEAESEDVARQIMFEHFDLKWFTSYDEKSFNSSYFTKGELLKINQR